MVSLFATVLESDWMSWCAFCFIEHRYIDKMYRELQQIIHTFKEPKKLMIWKMPYDRDNI